MRGVLRDEARHLDLRWARDETDLDLRNSRFRAAVADLAIVRGIVMPTGRTARPANRPIHAAS